MEQINEVPIIEENGATDEQINGLLNTIREYRQLNTLQLLQQQHELIMRYYAEVVWKRVTNNKKRNAECAKMAELLIQSRQTIEKAMQYEIFTILSELVFDALNLQQSKEKFIEVLGEWCQVYKVEYNDVFKQFAGECYDYITSTLQTSPV